MTCGKLNRSLVFWPLRPDPVALMLPLSQRSHPLLLHRGQLFLETQLEFPSLQLLVPLTSNKNDVSWPTVQNSFCSLKFVWERPNTIQSICSLKFVWERPNTITEIAIDSTRRDNYVSEVVIDFTNGNLALLTGLLSIFLVNLVITRKGRCLHDLRRWFVVARSQQSLSLDSELGQMV
jgi:hypothetical protein